MKKGVFLFLFFFSQKITFFYSEMQSAIHFNSQRKVRGRWSKEKLRFAVKTAANEKPWSQNRRLEDAWKDIADKVNGLFSDEVPLNPRVVKRCILEEARRVYSQSKSESAIDGMPADTEYEAYCCEVVKGVRFIHFCFLDNISNVCDRIPVVEKAKEELLLKSKRMIVIPN